MAGEESHTEKTEIYLVSHTWHSGILIKINDIPEGVLPEKDSFPECSMIEVGWGDKDYYMNEEAGVGVGLKALFWPTASVLHLVGIDKEPREFFPGSRMVVFTVDTSQAAKIASYISDRVKRDKQNHSFYQGEGLYGGGRFYLGTEKFSGFKTCNTWTGKVLRQGGIPVNTFMLLTAKSLHRRVRKYGTVVD